MYKTSSFFIPNNSSQVHDYEWLEWKEVVLIGPNKSTWFNGFESAGYANRLLVYSIRDITNYCNQHKSMMFQEKAVERFTTVFVCSPC